VVNGTPHPEPYLKGAAALGLKPVGCLVVEDAPAGIQAAHAGGMKVNGLASTYAPAKLTEANAVIQKLPEAVVRVVDGGLIVGIPAVDGHRPSLTIRKASFSDCGEMARLINSAFAIENFLEGDRTNEYELKQRMQKGEFLLGSDASGRLVASVYVEVRGTRGYFGMLAVEPKRQGKGLARKMVEAAEDYCREKGCGAMDLTVLSLRRELPPLYRKLGYAETGVEEFHPERAFLKGVTECHCIVMSKNLRFL